VKGDMRNPDEAVDLSLLEAGKLYPYHKNTGIYRCPTDTGVVIEGQRLPSVRSYSMNGFMGARPRNIGPIPPSAAAFVPFFARESDVLRANPSQMFVLVDEDDRSINDGFFITDPSARIWFDFPAINSSRHNFKYTVSFADGHSEVWSLHDPRTRSVGRSETEQSGNIDLRRLARASTVPK